METASDLEEVSKLYSVMAIWLQLRPTLNRLQRECPLHLTKTRLICQKQRSMKNPWCFNVATE